MRSVCKFGHQITKGLETCAEQHPLGASFGCSLPGCNFVTRPVDMIRLNLATRMLKNHMMEDHKIDGEKSKGWKKKTCPICCKKFVNKYMVGRHIASEHERKNRFECTKCSESFASKFAVNYHVKRNHTEDFRCEKCGMDSPDFKSYMTHKSSHLTTSSTVVLKCNECDKIFSSKSNLNRHYCQVHGLETRFDIDKVAVQVYPFQCDQCSSNYKRKDDLKVHVEHKHGPEENCIFDCQHCRKKFKYKSSLRKHEKKCTAAQDHPQVNPQETPPMEMTSEAPIECVVKALVIEKAIMSNAKNEDPAASMDA